MIPIARTITVVGLLLLLAVAEASAADDPFAELEKEMNADFSESAASLDELEREVSAEFDNSPQAQQQLEQEYEAWKNQWLAEYESFKKEYLAALADYEKKILKQWKSAEVTSPTTWVEYSSDMKTKRVVDYENNEIRVSTLQQPASQRELQALVEDNVKTILAESPNTARQKDPVLTATKAQVVFDDKQSKEGVLSELFEAEQPGATAVDDKAEQLAEEAVVVLGTGQGSRELPIEKVDDKAIAPPAGKPAKQKEEPIVVTIKLPGKALHKRAMKYQDLVEKFAAKNKLDKAMVYAIMHTESAFNPLARSHIPAYGLMQIVPESAGRDVAKKLYSEERLLSPTYLYDARNNIEAGTTYINILYYSYLRKIENPLSRLYCSIAAYNTGAGNVAKAFSGERKLGKAVPKINALTPQQVYDKLLESLPHDETKHYVKKVVSRKALYDEA